MSTGENPNPGEGAQSAHAQEMQELKLHGGHTEGDIEQSLTDLHSALADQRLRSAHEKEAQEMAEEPPVTEREIRGAHQIIKYQYDEASGVEDPGGKYPKREDFLEGPIHVKEPPGDPDFDTSRLHTRIYEYDLYGGWTYPFAAEDEKFSDGPSTELAQRTDILVDDMQMLGAFLAQHKKYMRERRPGDLTYSPDQHVTEEFYISDDAAEGKAPQSGTPNVSFSVVGTQSEDGRTQSINLVDSSKVRYVSRYGPEPNDESASEYPYEIAISPWGFIAHFPRDNYALDQDDPRNPQNWDAVRVKDYIHQVVMPRLAESIET